MRCSQNLILVFKLTFQDCIFYFIFCRTKFTLIGHHQTLSDFPGGPVDSPETWWSERTKSERVVRSSRHPRRSPSCRSETETLAVKRPNQPIGSSQSQPPRPEPHLVIVGAQVLEVSEADVGKADHDGDDQNHQSEHGGGGFEAWWH